MPQEHLLQEGENVSREESLVSLGDTLFKHVVPPLKN